MPRLTKKTDKLEVRLPPDVKRDFVNRCRVAGQSASETVRAMIQSGAQPRVRSAPPPAVRIPFIGVGLVTLLFGLLCVYLSGYGAWRLNARLGLSVFLVVQGALYVAAAIATFKLAWRVLFALLATQALVQLTFAAEVNPPASAMESASGILFGGLSPTILLALASLAAWAFTRRQA